LSALAAGPRVVEHPAMTKRKAADDDYDHDDITRLLHLMSQGDARAESRVFGLLYDALRERARAAMRGQPRGHTLQPTALVHEVYAKLAPSRGMHWTGRAHFLNLLAKAMRQVLVDHARKKKRKKRLGTRVDAPLEEVAVQFEKASYGLIDLERVLLRLEKFDAIAARIVDLHFFGGLNLREVAKTLDIPLRTVERRWKFARAWLRRELG
jgi:RNA polymerase sigma factor (TIGR02999 family)